MYVVGQLRKSFYQRLKNNIIFGLLQLVFHASGPLRICPTLSVSFSLIVRLLDLLSFCFPSFLSRAPKGQVTCETLEMGLSIFFATFEPNFSSTSCLQNLLMIMNKSIHSLSLFYISTLCIKVGKLPLFLWFLLVRHILSQSQTTLKSFPWRFLKYLYFSPS